MRDHLISFNFDKACNDIVRTHSCGHFKGCGEIVLNYFKQDAIYTLHYFTTGKFKFKNNKNAWKEFENDHILFFYPEGVYNLSEMNGQFNEHYYVSFSGKLPDLLLRNQVQLNRCLFKINKNKLYRQKFIELLETVRLASLSSYHQANAILYALLNETVLLLQTNDASTNGVKVIDNFIAYLNQNIQNNHLDMADYLKKVGLSQSSFTKKFKSSVGLTPHQYWLSNKINHAKSLLLSTEKNVNEIANLIGMDDEFYFSRLFKKKVGVSPKGYRERIFN